MREYEVVLIIHPETEPEGVSEIVERLKSSITAAGGEVHTVGQLSEDDTGRIVQRSDGEWRKRKLAYPIKKKTDGYYVVVQAQVDPAFLPVMERSFLLNESIMRHLIVRPDEA